MKSGSIAREVFGDEFVDHFGGTREHEVKLWNAAVTNWEGKSCSVAGLVHHPTFSFSRALPGVGLRETNRSLYSAMYDNCLCL